MKILHKLLTSATFVCVLAAGSAWAESPLISRMQAFVVELDAEGSEVFKPADKASPKQVIEYRLVYENTGEQPLKDLAVTGPIPQNTRYVADSAASMTTGAFQVSIDDGKNWEGEPVVRQRINDQGQLEEVIIPPAEYTHVRWVAQRPLAAESSQEYRYRVQIQ